MPDHDAGHSPGDETVPAVGRYGEHTATGAVSFRCGVCGEVAAVVKLLRAGEEADMGPLLGRQRQNADGVVIDYWLRSTCWMAANPPRWTRIGAVLSPEPPTPAALHAIDGEPAPYWCR